jgi:hypothetical protein
VAVELDMVVGTELEAVVVKEDEKPVEIVEAPGISPMAVMLK